MRYPPDRVKVRNGLEAQNQSIRNERKTLEKALEAVKTYTGKQINKRLCTLIENNSGTKWQEVTRWNSETGKDETEQKAVPVTHARIEKKDYGHEYTLTVYSDKYDERSIIYFDSLPDLIESMTKRIGYLDESISTLMEIEDTLDTLLDRYEKAQTEMEAIDAVNGWFYIRRLL